jgi:hypothetical protein
VSYPEGIECLKTFTCLPTPSLIGGNHEQHGRYGTDTCKHVGDETVVPWDVDECDLSAARHGRPSVAKIDDDATAALLNQAVGLHPSERMDERSMGRR